MLQSNAGLKLRDQRVTTKEPLKNTKVVWILLCSANKLLHHWFSCFTSTRISISSGSTRKNYCIPSRWYKNSCNLLHFMAFLITETRAYLRSQRRFVFLHSAVLIYLKPSGGPRHTIARCYEPLIQGLWMKKSHGTSRAVFVFCFCCDDRSMLATFLILRMKMYARE